MWFTYKIKLIKHLFILSNVLILIIIIINHENIMFLNVCHQVASVSGWGLWADPT